MYSKQTISAVLFVILSYRLHGQSIVGIWKTVDDQTGKPRSVVEIYPCGDKICGKIREIFLEPHEPLNPLCEACPKTDSRYNQPIMGMEIITGMKKENENSLVNGKILDPESGGIYDCKIWIENGQLKVRGYLYFFYRTQTWLPYDKS